MQNTPTVQIRLLCKIHHCANILNVQNTLTLQNNTFQITFTVQLAKIHPVSKHTCCSKCTESAKHTYFAKHTKNSHILILPDCLCRFPPAKTRGQKPLHLPSKCLAAVGSVWRSAIMTQFPLMARLQASCRPIRVPHPPRLHLRTTTSADLHTTICDNMPRHCCRQWHGPLQSPSTPPSPSPSPQSYPSASPQKSCRPQVVILCYHHKLHHNQCCHLYLYSQHQPVCLCVCLFSRG